MKIYGITLTEGSNIENFTTNSGTSFPANGNDGEIFYLTSGDIGFYAHAQGNWYKIITSPITLAGSLGDVVISSPQAGQQLVYNGTNWINGTALVRTEVTGNYTVLAGDSYLGVRQTAAVALTLPFGVANKQYVIKDELGAAGTYAITIYPNGTETIDGQSSYIINVNYGSVTLIFGANNWSSI